MGKHDIATALSRRLTVDWQRAIAPSDATAAVTRPAAATLAQHEAPRRTFCTGSSHEGRVDALGFAGFGTYVYPHGAVYEGYFRDGRFHGAGTISYPNGDYVEGLWIEGRLTDPSFNFSDNLRHEPPPWRYCEFPDRRFQEEEYALTLDNELPRRHKGKVPPHCYYTGDGYYRPDVNLVYSHAGRVLRVVTKAEEEQIRGKYWREGDEHVEFDERLYEFWTSGRAEEVERAEVEEDEG